MLLISTGGTPPFLKVGYCSANAIKSLNSLPIAPSDARLDEKMRASPSIPELQKSPGETVSQVNPLALYSNAFLTPIHKIVLYLATEVIPSLRRFLADSDKILGACNNIVYYIVTPAMKGRSKYVFRCPYCL